jgi:hypothetical protein
MHQLLHASAALFGNETFQTLAWHAQSFTFVRFVYLWSRKHQGAHNWPHTQTALRNNFERRSTQCTNQCNNMRNVCERARFLTSVERGALWQASNWVSAYLKLLHAQICAHVAIEMSQNFESPCKQHNDDENAQANVWANRKKWWIYIFVNGIMTTNSSFFALYL